MLRGVNPLLMSMLTLNFKIVPETLVSDTGVVNPLLMSLLTINFKIVPETLVSDVEGGQSSFDVHAKFFTLKL